MWYLLMLAKFGVQRGAKSDYFHHHNSTYASGSISGNLVVDVVGNGPEWSWRGQRASHGGRESESLVGRIMRVLEVLNLLRFVYLCIFFIL